MNLSYVQQSLKSEKERLNLISHPALARFKESKFTKEQVALILGQWYYPLENFPFFLSASIAHIRIAPIQTFISDILHEELGCGNPSQSHLDLYVATCSDAGITSDMIVNRPPFKATRELIDGYKRSVKKRNSALGFIYATEVCDLAMVSSIGTALGKVTGKTVKELPWVDIHLKQEPNHVNKVDQALNVELSQDDLDEILSSAREMWRLWINFFTEIDKNLNHGEPAVAIAD
ncbi:MAG: iron-containing redox enzyme family protein [Chryseolinea sp.]